MNLIRKWIFLPVAVKSRDLIPKLLFSDLASREGYGIFIGRNGMNISRDKFPQGIYFDKCLSPHKIGAHRLQVETFGNTLVSLDEEGFIVDGRSHAEGRFTQESIDLTSIIFTWGVEEASLISDRYKVTEKICVSGSPRIDSWRPEMNHLFNIEIEDIKRRYGNFILVNSDGFGAPILPEDRYSDSEKRNFQIQSEIRRKFLELIGRIAIDFPSRNVVLRPHPGEELGLWTSLESRLPSNVRIILEGSVSPWIRASSLLIHHCCTTAVEAWIGGTPTISYEPPLDGYPDYEPFHKLPSALSLRASSQNEVLSIIKDGFSNVSLSCPAQHAVAEKHFHFDTHMLASQKIISKLNELSIQESDYYLPSFTAWKKFRSFVGRAKYCISDLWDANHIPMSYNLQKNPGMNLGEITNLTDRIQLDKEQHSSPLSVHQVDVDTFCLFRAQKETS